MNCDKRIDLNKQIRNYSGSDDFLNSLQRNLKSKYCSKIKVGNKYLKVLSEKQYSAAEDILKRKGH